jgi:hypothetical protein
MNWLGAVGKNGYGRITIDGKSFEVHRVAYNVFVGQFDLWQHIRHTCDNKLCINPEHLLAGSHLDNMRDKADRGRARPQHGIGNYRAKLSSEDVAVIRNMAGRAKQSEIAERFGIGQPHVSDIINGKRRSRG